MSSLRGKWLNTVMLDTPATRAADSVPLTCGPQAAQPGVHVLDTVKQGRKVRSQIGLHEGETGRGPPVQVAPLPPAVVIVSWGVDPEDLVLTAEQIAVPRPSARIDPAALDPPAAAQASPPASRSAASALLKRSTRSGADLHQPAASLLSCGYTAVTTAVAVASGSSLRRGGGRKPEPGAGGCGLAAAGDAELLQHCGHVMIHGAHRDDQPVGDLGVGQPLGEQPEDLDLAVGQTGRVGAGGRLRS